MAEGRPAVGEAAVIGFPPLMSLLETFLNNDAGWFFPFVWVLPMVHILVSRSAEARNNNNSHDIGTSYDHAPCSWGFRPYIQQAID